MSTLSKAVRKVYMPDMQCSLLLHYLLSLSEGFYKKEIQNDIHTAPSKTAEERQQMIELLKRFEEENNTDQSLLQGDEEVDAEDPSSLARRFETIDIESTSPDALWSMLTPEERLKFTKALLDPTSGLAQQLLAAEQLEREIQEPWWEALNELKDQSEDDRPTNTARHYGAKPKMISVPLSMVKTVPTAHPLVYNMAAICISYAYVTRHLGASLCTLQPGDPDFDEARRLVSQLVPFLSDRKSSTIYSNLSTAITDLWSSLDPGTMTSELLTLLLRDAAHLLNPRHVTEITSEVAEQSSQETLVPASHPHSMPILVLSDLHGLFLNRPPKTPVNHITRKIVFYAAHVLSTPSLVLQTLVRELVSTAEKYAQAEGLESARMERKAEVRNERLVEEV
ncbi:hypothetical protein NLJ89_g819 [Agrocybe chaxingu]|uniref:Uncharacterized protein n=1 Tax=Agrocybe chaxingu TaxID=84603 RepID=A0A9W8N187_9AGAR|nr:hypothetical protein NLJ89_g819 [Agrocybe chaxingu]